MGGDAYAAIRSGDLEHQVLPDTSADGAKKSDFTESMII
jgi:hypothetical protein